MKRFVLGIILSLLTSSSAEGKAILCLSVNILRFDCHFLILSENKQKI